MSLGEVTEATTYLSYTSKHVLDERDESSDRTGLFVRAKPHAEANKVTSSFLLLLLQNLHLNSNVGEVLGHLASWTLDCHDS